MHYRRSRPRPGDERPSPADVERLALGVAGGALHADDGSLVELLERSCPGIAAFAAQAGNDAVDEILDAGAFRIEIHPRGRDAFLEQPLARPVEGAVSLGPA